MKKIYILFLSIILILAGCSSDPECSTYDTRYETYGFNEETQSCEVVNSLQEDVCGNGVEEEGETYCNCADDIPKEHPEFGCFGEVGEYVENACNQRTQECGLYTNDKVVEQTKSLEFSNRDITFDSRIVLTNPFIQNTDDENRVSVDIEVFSISDSVQLENIMIESLILEGRTSGVLFADIPYNQQVSSRGDQLGTKLLELNSISSYEQRENLQFTLVVSYTRNILNRDGEITRSEEVVDRLTASLSRWDIINPNLYEE